MVAGGGDRDQSLAAEPGLCREPPGPRLEALIHGLHAGKNSARPLPKAIKKAAAVRPADMEARPAVEHLRGRAVVEPAPRIGVGLVPERLQQGPCRTPVALGSARQVVAVEGLEVADVFLDPPL